MQKLSKLTLLAILALSLAFGFVSCDNSKTEEVKLLPATISVEQTIKYKSTSRLLTSNNTYEFTYNNKKQLTELTNTNQANKIAAHSFTYDATGKLIAIKNMKDGYPQSATYKYDELAGTVTAIWDGVEDDTHHINSHGMPQSNKHIDADKYQTYSYESFGNLVKIYDYEKTISEYEGVENIAIYEETRDSKYGIHFSPYRFLSLPAWFYTALPRSGVQLEMPFSEGLTGTYFPTVQNTNVAMTDDGVKTENVVTESTIVTVLEEQDNYPTEIKMEMTEKEDAVEVATTTTTYTITYQEM